MDNLQEQIVTSDDTCTQQEEVNHNNQLAAKKTFTGTGWKYSVFVIAATVFQVVLATIGGMIGEKVTQAPWFSWSLIAIPIYFIAFPILILISGKKGVAKPKSQSIGFGKFVKYIFIGAGCCGVGNVIGLIVQFAIILPFGVDAGSSNALANLMIDSQPFYRILTVGVLAPIFEELIFRKFLIDRIGKYGEKTAIVASGLMFGLFHGNFQQFFFATMLGMFWAYIYLKTGKVWYTMLLHAIINLSTSVITVFLLQRIDYDEISRFSNISPKTMTPEMVTAMLPTMIYGLWMMFLIGCCILGVILFLCSLKKIKIEKRENDLPKKSGKYAFANWGMILFYVLNGLMFVYYYVTVIAGAGTTL